MSARKPQDLDIPDDLALQDRTWKAQRVAWWAMAAILVAALLGLFGGGPFATGTAGPAGGPRVEYPRVCRLRSASALDVFAPVGPGGEARVWVASAYADAVEIDRADPTPVRVEVDPYGLTYVVSAPTTPEGGLVRVRFRLNPNRPGPVRGRVRPGDGPILEFTQYIHP
ncbi:hypothetical protein TA3x_005334 [Tundrisphaera sp. TA3]|uniref:hypothetical protein n=1 Tax=Tundrisphaera sp. TA3 TaxID=3435775 RepID=UPI003EBA9B56